LEKDVIYLANWSHGAASITDVWHMDYQSRQLLAKQIEENLDLMKKVKMNPF